MIVVLILLVWFCMACLVAWLVGHMARVGSREDD